MNILSIFVVILIYFLIKYIFRLLSIVAILKIIQQMQINIRKNFIKKGVKKWDLNVKNVRDFLIENLI
jgi:ABC-type iron transport system FetAB permease component